MPNVNGSVRRTGDASFRLAPASRVFMSGNGGGDGKPDEGWYHAREVDAAAQTDLPPVLASLRGIRKRQRVSLADSM